MADPAAQDRLLANVGRVLSDRRTRILLALAGFGAATLATVLIGQPRMFTGFSPYDDEGYMLIALRSFVEGGSLYDDVFSQYGPFYFEAWGGLFSILGLSVTHDAGRWVTLAAWVISSLGCGLAIVRMTGSILLGVLTQIVVFTALGSLPNEPMHAGGLICLLLVAVLLLSTVVRAGPSPNAMWALGMALAALVLIKVNVGAFAIAAVALVSTVVFGLLGRRPVRLLIEAAFVLTPIALMTSHLDASWGRDYAFHVSAAALAVVIVLRTRRTEGRNPEEIAWLAGGFAAASLAVMVAAVGSGTSLGGLVDGVLIQPLNQADTFATPLEQADRIYLLDVIALSSAIAYWFAARRRGASDAPVVGPALGVVSIVVGVELALSVVGKTLPSDATDLLGYQFSLLGFAWVALIPVRGERASMSFARLLLPPLAVLQALHAYPVAGSQISWAVFLLVPVAALCVWNGVRGLAQALSGSSDRIPAMALGLVLAATLSWYVVNNLVRLQHQATRGAYDAAVALDLPGAEAVRVPPGENGLYRRISESIRSRCDTLVMLPGMNSFYLWSERDPPDGLNATTWPTLFDDDMQLRVIEDATGFARLCALENGPLADGWNRGQDPDGPLVRFIREKFTPVDRFGDYRLLVRAPSEGA